MSRLVALAAVLGGVGAVLVHDTGRVGGQVALFAAGAVVAAAVVITVAAFLHNAERRLAQLVANEVDR